MQRTIAWWMLVGIAVAVCWAVLSLVLGPHAYNLGRSSFVALTAPAALLGRKMPLGLAWFVLLNGGIYALVGLAIRFARSLRTV